MCSKTDSRAKTHRARTATCRQGHGNRVRRESAAMLLIRVSLALLAFLVLPATAFADLRSPVLGDTTTLSFLAPQSRTYPPTMASDGNTTFVAYGEEWGGVTFHRISATGTEIGGGQQLQSLGTMSVASARIAVHRQNVYAARVTVS